MCANSYSGLLSIVEDVVMHSLALLQPSQDVK